MLLCVCFVCCAEIFDILLAFSALGDPEKQYLLRDVVFTHLLDVFTGELPTTVGTSTTATMISHVSTSGYPVWAALGLANVRF